MFKITFTVSERSPVKEFLLIDFLPLRSHGWYLHIILVYILNSYLEPNDDNLRTAVAICDSVNSPVPPQIFLLMYLQLCSSNSVSNSNVLSLVEPADLLFTNIILIRCPVL